MLCRCGRACTCVQMDAACSVRQTPSTPRSGNPSCALPRGARRQRFSGTNACKKPTFLCRLQSLQPTAAPCCNPLNGYNTWYHPYRDERPGKHGIAAERVVRCSAAVLCASCQLQTALIFARMLPQGRPPVTATPHRERNEKVSA
jgi:hypothetical protein